jgi:RimJ/RimL family protein N-acetyltransferase
MIAELNEFSQQVGTPLPGWQVPPTPPRQDLAGTHCRLEPLDPARHAAALAAAFAVESDARMWTYLPYGPFATPADYQAWMEATCLGADPLFFAIVDLATGQPTGVASYLRISPAAGSIEIGHLAYSAALRRTPAATEATFLLIDQAFRLGYRRVEWKCDALNAPSRSAAERLGFRFEGIFRQAAVVRGRNRDTAWYAIIDRDWPELARAFRAWLAPDNFGPDGRQRARLATGLR